MTSAMPLLYESGRGFPANAGSMWKMPQFNMDVVSNYGADERLQEAARRAGVRTGKTGLGFAAAAVDQHQIQIDHHTALAPILPRPSYPRRRPKSTFQ